MKVIVTKPIVDRFLEAVDEGEHLRRAGVLAISPPPRAETIAMVEAVGQAVLDDAAAIWDAKRRARLLLPKAQFDGVTRAVGDEE